MTIDFNMNTNQYIKKLYEATKQIYEMDYGNEKNKCKNALNDITDLAVKIHEYNE